MNSSINTSDSNNPHGLAEGNADLGLFYQLLQMVDGDWADSIQGICDHIHGNFHSLILTLTILDKTFNEFIYISYSIDPKLEKMMKDSGLSMTRDSMVEMFLNIYNNHKNVLGDNTFDEQYIRKVANTMLNNPERVDKILAELRLKTLTALPALVNNKKFKCFFHILSDRDLSEAEKNQIHDYIPQLNVALEIVFLVRELYLRATHDGLTRLFDHKQGLMLLIREMDRVKRNKQPLTVVMLDLDHFKSVNDTYGHQAGDEVLQYIGGLLTASLRKCDIMSRYGGEEFLVVLPDTPVKIAAEVISRLKDSIQKHVFDYEGKNFSITASFGMALYDSEKHGDCKALVESADGMLYRAKENGRNRIEY
jgi:diguanylate cyclase (GGDEF)-like protein